MQDWRASGDPAQSMVISGGVASRPHWFGANWSRKACELCPAANSGQQDLGAGYRGLGAGGATRTLSPLSTPSGGFSTTRSLTFRPFQYHGVVGGQRGHARACRAKDQCAGPDAERAAAAWQVETDAGKAARQQPPGCRCRSARRHRYCAPSPHAVPCVRTSTIPREPRRSGRSIWSAKAEGRRRQSRCRCAERRRRRRTGGLKRVCHFRSHRKNAPESPAD